MGIDSRAHEERENDVKLLDLYHRLPYAGRCLAAGARGLYLKAWRYGRATPRFVEEALAREAWTEDDWRRYHAEALRLLTPPGGYPRALLPRALERTSGLRLGCPASRTSKDGSTTSS